MLADAMDEEAACFYVRHGFEPSTEGRLTLIVPVAAVLSQIAE